MHNNNPSLSPISQSTDLTDELICLVLTEFPQHTNLTQTKSEIQDEFPFIIKIHIPNHNELQCYFDSMTDLIELDQGKKYGAQSAFIRHSQQNQLQNCIEDEFQKNQGVFQNSTLTVESDTINILPSYRHIPSIQNEESKNGKMNSGLLHYPKMERLTSLENEVEEFEHLRDELILFNTEIEYVMTLETEWISQESQNGNGIRSENQTFQNNGQKDCFASTNIQQKESWQLQKNQALKPTSKQIVFSLIEGAALTGIIYGGFKLLKNLIG